MTQRRPRSSTAAAATVAVLLLLVSAGAAAEAPPAVALFNENCAGCHSIGEGDLAGPDLIASTKWPRPDLRAAVERMQDNTGPLTAQQIDTITDLLKSGDAKAILAAASGEATAQKPRGSAAEGRRLFFGEQKFVNGGTPCFGCHAVQGRGGNLAVDLTAAHARLGDTALLSATVKPGFPFMKAAYTHRPVTEEEALHVTAFLQEAGLTASTSTPSPADRPGRLHAAAGGLALLTLGTVALVRSRRPPRRPAERNRGRHS